MKNLADCYTTVAKWIGFGQPGLDMQPFGQKWLDFSPIFEKNLDFLYV